jgi:hypothetical protein
MPMTSAPSSSGITRELDKFSSSHSVPTAQPSRRAGHHLRGDLMAWRHRGHSHARLCDEKQQAVTLPIAFNDPAGVWSLSTTDVYTDETRQVASLDVR